MDATEQNTDEAAPSLAAIHVGLTSGQVRQLVGEPRAVTDLGENQQQYEYPAIKITFQDDAVTIIQRMGPQRQSVPQSLMDTTERNTEKGHAKSSLWDRKSFRLLLFVGSYLAACVVIILTNFTHQQSPANSGFGNLVQVVVFVAVVVFVVLVLIAGYDTLVFFGGLLVFGSIAWAGTQTKSRRVFVALYAVFLVLLALNGIRWAKMAPTIWEDFRNALQHGLG